MKIFGGKGMKGGDPMRFIKNMQEFLKAWEEEFKHFLALYQAMPPSELFSKVKNGGCHHTHLEHILCIRVWEDTGVLFFNAPKYGDEPPHIANPLAYTNARLPEYRSAYQPNGNGVDLKKFWETLIATDAAYRAYLCKECREEVVFHDPILWTWLLKTSVAHLADHAHQLIWEMRGIPGKPEPEIWLNPYLSFTQVKDTHIFGV